jgi:tetratricopeptide (TPR) repeat protein
LLLLAAVIGATGCRSTVDVGDRSAASGSEGGLLSGLPGFLPGSRANNEQKADLQLVVARSFEREGKLDQATKIYRDVVQRGYRRAQAHHRLALIYDRQGEGSKAEEHYRDALEEEPRNAAIYSDLGYSYYLRGRMTEAEQNLRKAIALDPGMARAHNNLGLLLARTGRTDSALQEFGLAGCAETAAKANLAFALDLEKQRRIATGQSDPTLEADPDLAKAGERGEAHQPYPSTAERGGSAMAATSCLPAVVQAGLVSEIPAPNSYR